MSIRKVSDLEALHFDDSQHSAEDISCSLLEFSVPSHDARGHSFKSMMAEYRDVRQDIKNSIVNAPITFEYPVTFEETAFFHKGIHMSGDLFVNKDSPGWEDTTIEMYAGDITLCAANTMRLYSGNEIQLSAPTVTVGANSLTLKPFNKNGKFMEATAGGTGDLAVRFGAPVSCEALSCATPVSSDLARAATVEYVNSCIDALREELSSEPEEPGEFKLEEMNLYTSADIPHVKYMLEKLYSYTEPEYDDDGNEIGASVRRFAEYDIKTIPTKDADSDDSKDKYISFPNLLQKETTSVIAMESTNASSSTLKAQKIKTTTLTLIPLGEKDSVLASWVGGLDLKGVAKTEAASIRVFGEVVAVENLNQYVVMDAKFYREPG